MFLYSRLNKPSPCCREYSKQSPNISASIPQLLKCITKLEANGYNGPNYPANPRNSKEEKIKAAFGSTVIPVLCEGVFKK